ncbi:hypothetical protein EV13_1283 [Prochlorococcus sp. MIT 0702]|nr:hypothetical protein EV13_1283 [Prochlorococcus sp. MIT 0702]
MQWISCLSCSGPYGVQALALDWIVLPCPTNKKRRKEERGSLPLMRINSPERKPRGY